MYSKENEQILRDFLLWLGSGHRPATVSSYSDALRSFRKWLGTNKKTIYKLSLKDIVRYSNWLQNRGLRSGTVFHYMTALKTLWTWAYSQGFVELNPAMIPMPEYTRERREEITLQEFEQIMSSLDDSFPKELRDKAIISFFCITGVRLGEFLEINLSKMDFQERMVEVKTFKRKNHRRKVYWDNRTNELLFKWLDMREKIIGRGKREHDALFVSLDPTTYGEPLGRCAIQRVFKCAREKCGIKKQISPHSCRHGFATNAVRKGVNPVFLKEMLGHANMQNTMIYVHSEDKEIRDEHRRVFDS